MKSTELLIFRHGQTDWNKQGRLQGHTDIPLNQEGIFQAQELAKLMAPLKAEVIISSDLKRAVSTAQIVNEKLNLDIQTTEQLRECMLGDVEGMSRDQLTEKYGEELWKRWWLSSKAEDSNVGFPNGETKTQHFVRLQRFIESFCRLNKNYETVAVSTHGGSLRRIIQHCEGAPADSLMLPNCSLYRVRFEHDSSKWIFLGRVE